MGKKIKSEMDAQKKTFVEGAVARGVPEDQAAAIFDQVEKFAGYGFNKSHAAAYALVAYQTAYLKANYPVEFMAARSEEHTSELQSLMRISYAVFCLKKKNKNRYTSDTDTDVIRNRMKP